MSVTQGSSTSSGQCCTVQTTDSNASNYLAACCVGQFVDQRPVYSFLGHMLRGTKLFRTVPARPTP